MNKALRKRSLNRALSPIQACHNMPFIIRIKQLLIRHFLKLKWQNLLLTLIGYLCVTWLLLYLAGETNLTDPNHFFYWLIVTASTVGYGDMSPTTTSGRFLVALFVIPFGLSLFALTIGHVAAFATQQWKKGVQGLKTLELDNHVLVIGWNGNRTLHLLRLLQREEADSGKLARPIVLCCDAEIENPLPDQISFVRVNSYTQADGMARACIATAACIIIDSESDALTMTTSLLCYGANPSAHLIAYFADDSLATLLKKHCPTIECTPSVSVEMLAKAAVDPGSSALHHELLSVTHGMTQYSTHYPETAPPTSIGKLFSRFKERHDATLIGIRSAPTAPIALNPPLNSPVAPGAIIYYIADDRITQFNWSEHDA